jgi:hypothetical protein
MKKAFAILEKYKEGKISAKEAIRLLYDQQILEIKDFAHIDTNRKRRCGVPEVILAEGKEEEQVIKIVKELVKKQDYAILTRVNETLHKKIKELNYPIRWEKRARVLVVNKKGYKVGKTGGKVGIITGGTSDIPVAEEAKVIAEEQGCEVFAAHDVGVAGIHRLIHVLRDFFKKRIDVYIVAAGREGALPTLVAGLVDAPVIGLPTSGSYGIGGEGKAPLYSMLQSCSPLSVVNVDGGFVAGVVASKIANKIAEARSQRT